MIYFDNSATTQVKTEVYEAMIPYLTTEYGNPSSKYYPLAVNAKNAVIKARESVAKLIGANSEEIIFTSGATESTNMIIKGISDYKKYYEKTGNHIITSNVEHKATLNVCKFLNGDIYSNNDAVFSFAKTTNKIDRGFEVSFLDATKTGLILPEVLKKEIKNTTVLASIIWGNNEIGTLNDIKALGAVCHEDRGLFHTDATQVVGKIPINVKDLNVDFMSFSAHKIYGPKGIGAAYIKSDEYGLPPFSAFIHGGEQEEGLRGGTLAVHNIVGFGKAAEIVLRDREITNKNLRKLDVEIIKILTNIPNIQLIGDLKNRLPGIYSILIDKPDFNNERFLKKISNEFSLSSGSACTAGQPSHVLKAIGLSEYINKVIRISISNNDNNIDINVIADLLRGV